MSKISIEKFELIKKYGLFPVVPINNNAGFPVVKWSDPKCWVNNFEELVKLTDATGAALLTGEKSGVMVVDLDVNHMDGVDGIKTFNELWPGIPDTLMTETPNGGIHIYFKYRKGLKNRADYFPGIDIRTDGGVIVAPGSQKKKKDGTTGNYQVMVDRPIEEMPDGLFELFKERDISQKKEKTRSSDNDGLGGEVYPSGKRNDSLFRDGMMVFSKTDIKDHTIISAFLQTLNNSKCQPPLDQNEVERIAKSVWEKIQTINYFTPDGKVIPFSLARHVMKDRHCFSRGNLTFFYNNEKGFYEHVGAHGLHKIYFASCQSDTDRTVRKAKEFAEIMLMVASEEKRNYEEKKFANCLNGTVNLETETLMPYSNEYRLTGQFQANFRQVSDPEFKNSRLKRFLDEILDLESQLTLQEAMGLLISPRAQEVQQAFIFLGNGKNGKSALMEIMQALIGSRDNICSIGLSDFSKDFDISAAEGKIANIVMDDDLSGVKVGAAFKSMICGEAVRVNRKNKDIKVMNFNMTHYFNLNRLPSASDKSDGFYRRFCIIPFNNTFGTEEEFQNGLTTHARDPIVTRKIIDEELDLFFWWALQGLKRLKVNNWKLTISKAALQEMEIFKADSDSAYAFFSERIEASPGNDLPVASVIAAYDCFCGQNGINKPMSGSALGKQLKSFGIKQVRTKTTRYYKDIRIINEGEKYVK